MEPSPLKSCEAQDSEFLLPGSPHIVWLAGASVYFFIQYLAFINIQPAIDRVAVQHNVIYFPTELRYLTKKLLCHKCWAITFFRPSAWDVVNFGHHCVLRAKRCRKRPGTFKLPRRPASKIPLNHFFTFTFCHFTKMAHFGCKDFFRRTFCIFPFQKSFLISKVVDR